MFENSVGSTCELDHPGVANLGEATRACRSCNRVGQSTCLECSNLLLPVLRALLRSFGTDSWLARHNRIEDLCLDWLEFRAYEPAGSISEFVDILIAHEATVMGSDPDELKRRAMSSITATLIK